VEETFVFVAKLLSVWPYGIVRRGFDVYELSKFCHETTTDYWVQLAKFPIEGPWS